MPSEIRVLGIETSCDETAAAVVGGDGSVLAEVVHSQLDEHALYGGVVPELAARAHLSRLDRLVSHVLAEAGCGLGGIDAIAVTAGPGLAGGLLVGVVTAQALAAVHGLPVVAINHLEAHALTARLTDGLPFPYLLLLVSGGHCQLLEVRDVGEYRLLGGTIDDAVGEAFDKLAKMLGLGFPGGPAVERAAVGGDPARFPLPRPLLGRPGCDFSFSGLKTAVRQRVLELGEERLDAQAVADLCAAFQAAVCDILVDRTRNGLRIFRQSCRRPPDLVVAGGVAANRAVRAALAGLASEEGARLVVPPARLCTDNAVMVAWAAIERLRRGLGSGEPPCVRTRWPLDAAGMSATAGPRSNAAAVQSGLLVAAPRAGGAASTAPDTDGAAAVCDTPSTSAGDGDPAAATAPSATGSSTSAALTTCMVDVSCGLSDGAIKANTTGPWRHCSET